jgi:hypothetical protein
MKSKKTFCIWSQATGYMPHTTSHKKKESIELFETGQETGFDWKFLKLQGYECHEVVILKRIIMQGR